MKIFKKNDLPMVPLKDLVVFPQMVVPFFVGRERSLKAVEEANSRGKIVFLTTQKSGKAEDPGQDDLYPIGTLARILQTLRLPDGTVRVLVEGTERAGLVKITEKKRLYKVMVEPIAEQTGGEAQVQALVRGVKKEFERYAELVKKIPKETVEAVQGLEEPHGLVNTICASVPLKVAQKVELLSLSDPAERLERLVSYLASEVEVLEVEKRISSRVRKRVEKAQKRYYLSEQLKEIQKELGDEKDDPTGAGELEARLTEKELPEPVQAKCMKDAARLARLQPISPETGVLRTYLEWICDLPWNESSEDNGDIEKARRILEEDHYGLEKVKERILDFIAVRQLKNTDRVKGPILCFVGPPGTGKTSLGRSVARALGREFVRVSLGGVRDEAEIRGHRKTYIGALPGKILQSMRKATTRNPVFLLDEIDKMSQDFRGDPASAMLEVLDPEQNATFMDHYLEVPYDLSGVMFITTANAVHQIPHPLRDRMEIIRISGYTEFEKEKIARQFLIPKQIEENGLGWASITFRRAAIHAIIRGYTMESGVRSLEREIANVIRKIAREAVKRGLNRSPDGAPFRVVVTTARVERCLGKPRFREKGPGRELKPGLAYGLAWTEAGGTLLPVETALIKGRGDLSMTGSLGDVMKESAQTALSFLKAHTTDLGIPESFFRRMDVHIHVPEGAVPKDGPSAGITVAAALLSAVTGRTVREGLAMTGEITLTGRLLPIGGVKEKALAAHRNSMTRVLLPAENRRDVEELPEEVRSALTFVYAETMGEALRELFTDTPEGAAEAAGG